MPDPAPVPTPPATAPPAAPPATLTAPTDPPAGPAVTPPAPPAGETIEQRAARLERELRAARAEAGKDRNVAKATAAEEARTALLGEIGKALGYGPAQQLTAEQLAEKLTASDARGDSAEAKLSVYRAATAAGANADALLDSVSFLATVQLLDATKADYPTKLGAAITAALEANPALRTSGQAPPTIPPSGGDFAGGNGTAGPGVPLAQQIADAEKAGNHRLALQLKRRMAPPA